MTAGVVADVSERPEGSVHPRTPVLRRLASFCRSKVRCRIAFTFWRRYGLHVALAGVVSVVALAPGLSLPTAGLSLAPSQNAAGRAYVEEEVPSFRGRRPAPPVSEVRLLQREALVRTIQADYPEWHPRTYHVSAGDTVSEVAQRFGLDLRTLIWANSALVERPDWLSLGQELLILPVDGAYHTVADGETLAGIAEKYAVSPDAILAYKGNDIEDPGSLPAGLKLIVPGANLPEPPRPTPTPRPLIVARPTTAAATNEGQTLTAKPESVQTGSGSMAWPLSGMLTQGYGRYHQGIDIHTPAGRPVVAADAGTVVLVSWMRYSYGYHVIVDHGNGVETLYAHLSAITVEVGQNVDKGGEVGKVGSTGRSTGPHLHFEVRENGARRNPFNYLN